MARQEFEPCPESLLGAADRRRMTPPVCVHTQKTMCLNFKDMARCGAALLVRCATPFTIINSWPSAEDNAVMFTHSVALYKHYSLEMSDCMSLLRIIKLWNAWRIQISYSTDLSVKSSQTDLYRGVHNILHLKAALEKIMILVFILS